MCCAPIQHGVQQHEQIYQVALFGYNSKRNGRSGGTSNQPRITPIRLPYCIARVVVLVTTNYTTTRTVLWNNTNEIIQHAGRRENTHGTPTLSDLCYCTIQKNLSHCVVRVVVIVLYNTQYNTVAAVGGGVAYHVSPPLGGDMDATPTRHTTRTA